MELQCLMGSGASKATAAGDAGRSPQSKYEQDGDGAAAGSKPGSPASQQQQQWPDRTARPPGTPAGGASAPGTAPGTPGSGTAADGRPSSSTQLDAWGSLPPGLPTKEELLLAALQVRLAAEPVFNARTGHDSSAF